MENPQESIDNQETLVYVKELNIF